jgi:putative RecB family exonuclease
MKLYSHSRLSCYEQCPQKYKLQYIDKVDSETEESIEAFLGVRVHETLEKLYCDLQYQKLNSLQELLKYFKNEWDKYWDDAIVIVKKQYSAENYQKMGIQFITDYYNKYKPFNQGKIISLEERIIIQLDQSGEYKLQGYIDRVQETAEGYYEIHDYKTNSRLPLPQYIENDRQLALYAIGIKERYPDVKDVRLIWHFLAFNKEIDSTRTDQELKELKKKTIQLIDTIESDNDFKTKPSVLCDWCEFKPICKEWSHLYMIKDKPENEYLGNPGVKLVNRYAELKQKQKQITLDVYAELEKIEAALIDFSQQQNVDVIFGSKNKVRIKEIQAQKFPPKHSKQRQHLEEILKKNNLYNEVIQLDTTALQKILQDKKIDSTLHEIIQSFIQTEHSKRLYLSKIK